VADDEAAASPLIRAAMGMAVQGTVEVQILPVGEVDYATLSSDPVRTLVLVRDLDSVLSARQRGLSPGHVNLGNVHFAAGRTQVSPSVFLSPREVEQLKSLADAGVEVEARAVPSDRAVRLQEMEGRVGRGT
jgi:mannose/fructose/N-acetylgalactosamine-specific phosphotransferase system component IIB